MASPAGPAEPTAAAGLAEGVASPGPAVGSGDDGGLPPAVPAPQVLSPQPQPAQPAVSASASSSLGDDRIAVCGYTIQLPGEITTGEQLFDLCRQKAQCRRDMVALGRYPASIVDESADGANPWKLKTRYCNMFSEEEVESYDCHFFRVTQKLAKSMDIRQVGVLQSVWHALEDAGIPAQRIYRTRTGIFAAGYVQVEGCSEAPDETTLRGNLMSSLSDHVAFFLGTHGPSLTLETACSSSLVALAMAVAALRKGDCDYAIVTCVNIPQDKDFHLSLQACGVLSATGTSHPFDEDGPKGYVRAEGYGSIVLRRQRDALLDGDRVACTIRNAVAGSAGAVEGISEGAGRMYESPCVWGMKQLMQRAWDGASLDPARLDYMECHATGTYVGDVLELQAIGEVLGRARRPGQEPLRIASVKSNIGHAEVSAGMFSLAKVIEMLRHRTYLPTAGVRKPRSDFAWADNNMRVIQAEESFGDEATTPPVLMAVNSFGIGGSYAHVIVEEYRPPPALARRLAARPPALACPALLPLSAVSNAHLRLYASALASHLHANPDLDIRDVCGTMAVNRTPFKYRHALLARTVPELAAALEAAAAGADVTAPEEDKGQRILFVFTGQGSQWPGVGETLLQFPPYREAVEEADALFSALSGWSILERARALSAEELRDTQYAQPVTFLVQVGLVKLLESFGVLPSIVVGHSAGEVASAWAAGLLTLEEAVQVVYYRSAEQQKLAGCGRLLAVGLGQNAALEFLAEQGFEAEVEIACVNAPTSAVLAGSEATLERVKAALPEGTFGAFVPGNIAFHSSHVEPILPEIRRRLAFLDDPARASLRPLDAPLFVSTVTGEEQGTADARYWCENVRRAVVFEHAVNCIFAEEGTAPDLVLEIGPHKTLAGPLLQIVKGMGREAAALPTLKRGEECAAVMAGLLGELFKQGVRVEMQGFYDGLGYQQVDLPKHPYIKTRMHEHVPIHKREKWAGGYLAGPVAGSFKAGAFEVEVCDRTCKQMMDHKMGGQEILPGTMYVEMAIEAVGVPCTLTNVEFKSMCKIPRTSGGDISTLVSCVLREVEGSPEMQAFLVRSTPAKARAELLDEPRTYTDHCTGFAVKGSALLTSDGELDPDCHLRPSSFGLLVPWKLRDIGREGLAALKAEHTHCLAGSREQFYGIVNKEGLSEYGSSFQVVTALYGNMVNDTYLGTVEFDNDAWSAQGGSFGIQLMDAMYQMLFLLPSHDPQIVVYAGGFEAAHFLRKPTGTRLFAWLDHDSRAPYIGRKKCGGDILVYDEEGRLVFCIKGISCIFGASTDTTKLSDLVWQPRTASADAACLADYEQAVLTAAVGDEQPQPQQQAALLVERLAEAVARAAQRFHSQQKEAPYSVFRVLECVEASNLPTLAEALDRMDLPAEQIVEVFIASHDLKVLNLVGGAIGRTDDGLRVRKVLLPALGRELADYAFDVVALHGWHATGAAPWAAKGPSEHDPAGNALEALESFLTPGAQLLALGLEGAEEADAWLAALRPLAPQAGAARRVAVPGAEAEAAQASVVVARTEPRVPSAPRTFLVLAEEAGVGKELARRLGELGGAQCQALVLTCGAQPKVAFQDGAPATQWALALGKALDEVAATGAAFAGLVFLAGLGDETVLGTKGFGRLAKLCQAAQACEALIAGLAAGGGGDPREAHLWVVTEGCYGGTIRPNQGTMQGFTYVIAHELPAMEARLIDLATDGGKTTTFPQALARAAEVLAFAPREKVYRVSSSGVEVPRYFPLDIKARRSRLVSPLDREVAYFCDVSAELSTPGQVNVDFQTQDLPPPGEGQVTVDIRAAALNFRDVLIAINMLPELSFEGSYYGRHLGMEAAGVVAAVGAGVTGLKVGDRVATAEASCFANRLNAPARRVAKLHDSISFEVAASTQSVYNTAHHALVTVARIKKGDRVLVHAAAGGVGHAAISVCQHVGAIVYATASAGKRAAVRALGVEHIYDSRSTSWFADLMRDTDNRGVDAVLNSLAGKHQQLGVQALAPGGRFLEIGKLDIYDNAKLGLLALRKNALFTAIDMDRLALDDPELTIQTTAEVFDLLAAGAYKPIPATVYTMDRIQEAIELMKAGKHTGKVVLSNYTPQGAPVPVRVRMPQRVFRPDGTYLITGAAGGFGSKIVRMAFEKGARHFLLTVTREPERCTALFRDIIDTPGCTLEAVVADTASEADMAALVKRAAQPGPGGRPPLAAVFHVAGISLDTVLTEVKAEDLLKVGACKALGAWYLHQATRELAPQLHTFCVVSSVASLMGGRGRSAYSAANAFMDALVRHRHALGLPGTAFNMTSLSDVGILANDVKVRQMQLRSNVEFVRSARALQDLEDAVVIGLPLGCELFFRENAVGVYPNRASFLHGGRNIFTLGADAAKTGDRALTLKEIQTLIAETIKAISGHKEVLGSSALFSVGMDSFSTVELISRVKQLFGVEVNPSKIGPSTTVADLSKMVFAMQSGGKAGGGAGTAEGEGLGPGAPAAEGAPGAAEASTGGAAVPRLRAGKSLSALPKKRTPPRRRLNKDLVAELEMASLPAGAAPQALQAGAVPGSPPRRGFFSKEQQQGQQPAAGQQGPHDDGAGTRVLVNAKTARPRYGRTGVEGEEVAVPVSCFGLYRQTLARPAMDAATAEKWLHVETPRPLAKARVVCLPWAGGSARVFNQWQLGKDVEVVSVIMPGRDYRVGEKPLSDVYLVAETVVRAVEAMGWLEEGEAPLSLFGTSYSSYIVLEMAHLLKANLGYTPARIFVSSSYPPHRRFPLWWYHLAPTPLVWFFLRFLAGLPKEFRSKHFLNNYKVLSDTQRDLHAMDWYKCRTDRFLDCPIHVLNGDQDRMTPHTETVVGWADFTSAAMHVKLLHGSGHLFVLEKEAGPELLAYLQETLVPGSAPGPGLQARTLTAPPRLTQGKLLAISGAGGETKQQSLENLRAGTMTRDSSASSEP